tara:strand:- start:39 stop:734 length:696 start_codon:yes stop_codon:yes gene_type:complete
MARIKLYPNDTSITGGDKLVGTDINGNATKNYQIEELAQYFEQTGNSLFQYNFAGTYSTEVINSGEYRYQVNPSAPTIYNWAQITGIAISRYNRNGEDVTPMVPLLINQVIKITDISTSQDLGYGLFQVTSSTVLSSGNAFLLTLNFKGASSTVGNDIISLAPFGTEGYEYTFTQSAAAATWTIVHNLGRFPSVTTVDSAGSIINGAITYNDENTITVVFTSATSGKAYLN